jgi:hypothetical protein
MRDTTDFRRQAEECVRRAQQTDAPQQKAVLIQMAQYWLKLAEHAEQLQALAGENKS